MNIFSDNSLFSDFIPPEDRGIFEIDEFYKNNQTNFDLYFKSEASEDEKDIYDPFKTAFKESFPNFEEQVTNFETKKKDIHFLNNNSNNSNIKMPKSYIYEDIRKIIKEKIKDPKILDIFKKDEKIEKYENVMNLYDNNLLQNKRNRSKNKGNENEVPYARGRKKKGDNTKRKHDKYSIDNIMKKIKTNLLEIAIEFINQIVNKSKEESQKILFKKIGYKYINQMKQDIDIELLNGTLKDLLLKDVSRKYSVLSEDSNRINLEELMKNEKNNETIMFMLNLKFRELIELYLSKITMNDLESSRNIDSSACQTIVDELPKIDSLLNKISKKNDGKFLSLFIFLLYNYEKIILIKKGRNSKKNLTLNECNLRILKKIV